MPAPLPNVVAANAKSAFIVSAAKPILTPIQERQNVQQTYERD